MNDQFEKSNYKRKIKDTVSIYLEKISSPNILEFGVRKGISTSIFLDLCKNNKGKLFSVVTSISYATKGDARAAIALLPKTLRERQPWIKSISIVIDEINTFEQ